MQLDQVGRKKQRQNYRNNMFRISHCNTTCKKNHQNPHTNDLQQTKNIGIIWHLKSQNVYFAHKKSTTAKSVKPAKHITASVSKCH